MANNRDKPQKRVVKFIPTDEQRRMEVREWKEVTPELSALLQRLDDKSAANVFIEKYGKKMQKLPPKTQLLLFPETLRIKDLKNVDALSTNIGILSRSTGSERTRHHLQRQNGCDLEVQ